MSKIYFAGSIRGGTHKAKHYSYMINCLKALGHEVLSEHIFTDKKETLSDPEIFSRDIAWIEDAEYLVADVTLPSLGVGYEIGYALNDCGIPVLCIAEDGTRVSAMITGNPLCEVVYYPYTDTAVGLIQEWLSERNRG